MKVGLFALGIGAGARPDTVLKTAETAERVGFSTLWVGEHVVLFDAQDSKYPYTAGGEFPLPGGADWLDPFITLTFAAAVTKSIRLATGICLVPEHNPLVLAKEVASLDRLARGRFALGVGIGWSAEEFAALGIPFERRAQRTREYIDVMRRLWSEDATSFHGEFVNFDGAKSFPKPARGARLPIIFGGESGPALRRSAEYGNGWFGFNLDPNEAAAKIKRLRELLDQNSRDASEVEIIACPYTKKITAADVKRYASAGVDELVILANPPEDESRVAAWVERLANQWIAAAR
ncbi:MAG: LLM class F420-dependent oxidoreductase [Candidatus Binatus sp.]|uniref:LLM class F420-dependent oxidoreductase n=1 Tax=Candidatus Binatus sp. TaxID=2811406 RepID=UPI0027157203|nr:LLM class F420-dependent oxidoreductase [Candidatus Binatus sp.]MDO8433687.1 LLM class F420-dependent oxidoreductase [Candidatus Binatus sp.]